MPLLRKPLSELRYSVSVDDVDTEDTEFHNFSDAPRDPLAPYTASDIDDLMSSLGSAPMPSAPPEPPPAPAPSEPDLADDLGQRIQAAREAADAARLKAARRAVPTIIRTPEEEAELAAILDEAGLGSDRDVPAPDLDVSMAPGCYGIAMLFQPTSGICTPCSFSFQCATAKPMIFVGDTAPVAPVDDPAKTPTRALTAEYWTRKRDRDDRKKARTAVGRRERDKVAKRTFRGSVKAINAKRLAALQKATSNPKGDKRLEQLRDQVESLVIFRDAMALAPGASLQKLANCYNNLTGEEITKDAARNRRTTIGKLEAPGGLWRRWK